MPRNSDRRFRSYGAHPDSVVARAARQANLITNDGEHELCHVCGGARATTTNKHGDPACNSCA